MSLSFVTVNPAKKPEASVIWLHGLGADGHDFEGIVPGLHLPEDLPIRFIFPHAPMRPITMNGGYMMRAWFDMEAIDLNSPVDKKGILEAEQAVEALIDRERSSGMPDHRIILAGFSQGGGIALYTGLRYPHRLGGILALSTYLPLDDAWLKEVNMPNRLIPVLLIHGTLDPLVPISFAERTYHHLVENGCNVKFNTYPMQHGVCLEEIEDISMWLQEWGQVWRT